MLGTIMIVLDSWPREVLWFSRLFWDAESNIPHLYVRKRGTTLVRNEGKDLGR